ncbi:unnamed protein product, partial [Mesorhabditis spiculigera]
MTTGSILLICLFAGPILSDTISFKQRYPHIKWPPGDLEQQFRSIDANGDNNIEQRELIESLVLNKLGHLWDGDLPDLWQTVLDAADGDHDGQLNMEEYGKL